MKIEQVKIYKKVLNKILSEFQSRYHVVFRDPVKAKALIEYSIASFVVDSNFKRNSEKINKLK